jgi:predicted Zn-dependent peptidase
MHFKAPRMVLASAGGVSHEQLGALAQKYLSGVSAQYTLGIPAATPSRYTGSELRMRDDDVPLAYLAFAVQGCAATSPDYVPLLVARDYVGRWERSSGGGHHHASKLVQALVDYDNRALSFNSFNLSYSDTGLWGIQFVADRFGIDDAITEIQKNWLKLATGSSDFEVERAKNQLKTNLALQLEGTTPVADEIGRQVLLYGRRLSLQELFTRIDLVDSKQVREVGLKYIYDRCPAIAAVGPIEDLRPYNRVRGNMWWFRY